MKYLMVDISGKVPKYDIALCEAISSVLGKKDELVLLAANINPQIIDCKSKRLLSLVPKKFQNSDNKFKRAVKALEGFLNYLYLVLYVFFKRPSIIHFQWLPFLEISSVECVFLRLIKFASTKSKIWLTVHNIYPHNSNDTARSKYKARFDTIEKFFDSFILHLQSSKDEFCKQFDISELRCRVIPHGVFEPKNLKITHHERRKKIHLVMYGNQSFYKGTDILVDAIAMLPKEIQSKFSTTIVGQISEMYLKKIQERAKGLNIKFIPEFVSDEILNEIILESDVIVMPYREISQSGALLLALYFERTIICSKLPSFKETLIGFDDDSFFEPNSVASLSNTLAKLTDSSFDFEKHEENCRMVRKRYLWKNISLMYVQDNKCV